LMSSFYAILKEKHGGSLVKAWKQSLDRDKSGSIKKEELVEAMKALEWDGDAGRVYDLLDYDHGGSVTLEEIDEKAAAAMARGDDLLGLDVEVDLGGKSKADLSFEERNMTENQRRNAAAGKAKREAVEAEAARAAAADVGAHNFEEWKGVLTRKYGNLLRAWKVGLDSDGSNKLSFVEFCQSARAEGFAGNLKALWKEMGGADDGFVTLEEFAPQIAELMTSFKSFLKEKHEGSLVKAWKQSLDLDKSGSIKKEELVEAMAKLGWQGDAARVYKLLDFDHGGSITLEEIDEKASGAMQRGDDLLGLDVDEPDSGKKKSEMSFEERQKTASSRRQQAEGKDRRAQIDKAAADEAAKNVGATDLSQFKAALTRKYGNLYRGWLNLDRDGGGTLAFQEFCRAARDEGYAGDLKALWKELDAGGGGNQEESDGFISLEEFAPEIAKLMKSFYECLRGKHDGSIVRAWKQTLDTDKSGMIQKEELIEAMKKLEWDGDAAKVFQLLDTGTGKLALEDIDREAHKRMQAGKE